jgi:hypothetical protein
MVTGEDVDDRLFTFEQSRSIGWTQDHTRSWSSRLRMTGSTFAPARTSMLFFFAGPVASAPANVVVATAEGTDAGFARSARSFPARFPRPSTSATFIWAISRFPFHEGAVRGRSER